MHNKYSINPFTRDMLIWFMRAFIQYCYLQTHQNQESCLKNKTPPPPPHLPHEIGLKVMQFKKVIIINFGFLLFAFSVQAFRIDVFKLSSTTVGTRNFLKMKTEILE